MGHACTQRSGLPHPTGLVLVLVVAMGLAAAGDVRAQAPPPGPPDFVRDLLPVIERQCLRCHNATTMKGEFVMDGVPDILRGGESGRVVVPGRADDSALVAMIERRAEPRMPPKHDLRAEEIALFRAWIDGGARPSPFAPPGIDARVTPLAPEGTPAVPVDAIVAFADAFLLGGYKRVALLPAHPAQTPRVYEGPGDLVRALTVSPDRQWVAGGSGIPGGSGEVIVWDAASGEARHRLEGHRDVVYDVAFSPDGVLVASASYDRSVRVWNLDQGRPYRVLREHTDAVFGVAFSPDGRWLASASADRGVKLWDLSSGTRLWTLSDATDAVLAVAFHPATGELWAAGADRHLRAWRVTEAGATARLALLAHAGPILRLAFSPDGTKVATSSADLTVKIWETATGTLLRSFDRQQDWAHGLAWATDGTTLAVGRRDGSLSMYDLDSGEDRTPLASLVSPLPARRPANQP
jgi:WD40 repeat protein